MLAMNSLRPRLGPDPESSLSRQPELHGAQCWLCACCPAMSSIHYTSSPALLLLFFLSCTQIVTAIAKPPPAAPRCSLACTLLQFVLLGTRGEEQEEEEEAANSNMGQTQQAYQMQCPATSAPTVQARPQQQQQHSKCLPCSSSSSSCHSSPAACNALSRTICRRPSPTTTTTTTTFADFVGILFSASAATPLRSLLHT